MNQEQQELEPTSPIGGDDRTMTFVSNN